MMATLCSGWNIEFLWWQTWDSWIFHGTVLIRRTTRASVIFPSCTDTNSICMAFIMYSFLCVCSWGCQITNGWYVTCSFTVLWMIFAHNFSINNENQQKITLGPLQSLDLLRLLANHSFITFPLSGSSIFPLNLYSVNTNSTLLSHIVMIYRLCCRWREIQR